MPSGPAGPRSIAPIDRTLERSWLERPADVTALAQGRQRSLADQSQGRYRIDPPVPGLSTEVATLAVCFAIRSEDLICSPTSRSTPLVTMAG